jgi:hypothetical protein
MTASTAPLLCPSCGHDLPAERGPCDNCGFVAPASQWVREVKKTSAIERVTSAGCAVFIVAALLLPIVALVSHWPSSPLAIFLQLALLFLLTAVLFALLYGGYASLRAPPCTWHYQTPDHSVTAFVRHPPGTAGGTQFGVLAPWDRVAAWGEHPTTEDHARALYRAVYGSAAAAGGWKLTLDPFSIRTAEIALAMLRLHATGALQLLKREGIRWSRGPSTSPQSFAVSEVSCVPGIADGAERTPIESAILAAMTPRASATRPSEAVGAPREPSGSAGPYRAAEPSPEPAQRDIYELVLDLCLAAPEWIARGPGKDPRSPAQVLEEEPDPAIPEWLSEALAQTPRPPLETLLSRIEDALEDAGEHEGIPRFG